MTRYELAQLTNEELERKVEEVTGQYVPVDFTNRSDVITALLDYLTTVTKTV